jgi:hypothetical protein
MKKLLIVGLALASVVCSAQLKGNKAYDRRYYGHWETNIPLQDNIQLIIYKGSKQSTHVQEMIIDNKKCLGSGVMQLTTYVCTSRKGTMVAELIDPKTLAIIQSEYIVVSREKLLKITDNDTITLIRKY